MQEYIISNPTNQNTTAAPRIRDSIEISSLTATHAPTGAIEIATPNHKCDKDVKRLANEYPKIIPKATGERINAREFNMNAENKKTTEDTIKKNQYCLAVALPAGKALPLVRGFNLSSFESAILLNAIAPFLAPNMAIRIHAKVPNSGTPSAARKALITANGRANTVC